MSTVIELGVIADGMGVVAVVVVAAVSATEVGVIAVVVAGGGISNKCSSSVFCTYCRCSFPFSDR